MGGEALPAGLFLVADAVLDVGVGAHDPVQLDDVGVVLVGHKGGEPVPGDVVEGQLRAGVARLAAHDQPGPRRELGEVHGVGELDHGRAVALLTVLGDRRLPRGVGAVMGGADGVTEPADLHVHREPDAGLAGVAQELVGGAGGVRAHDQPRPFGQQPFQPGERASSSSQ